MRCLPLILMVLMACGRDARPPGILDEQQMTLFLVDIYLAEARMSQFPMKRYGVSDSIVRLSYQYYFEHPKEFDRILEAAIDTLSLREQRMPFNTQSQ
jgi:hypothetical protein